MRVFDSTDHAIGRERSSMRIKQGVVWITNSNSSGLEGSPLPWRAGDACCSALSTKSVFAVRRILPFQRMVPMGIAGEIDDFLHGLRQGAS